MHTQMFSFLQFHFSFKANFYSSHLFLRVAAEIFLIWTNVARTNYAWTNVTLAVGICSKC